MQSIRLYHRRLAGDLACHANPESPAGRRWYADEITSDAFGKKRQRGATLLEILCSLTLLSFGVFASMQVFHQSAQHALFLAQEQRALRILENEIERHRALPFAELLVAEEIPLRAGADELAPLAEARGSVAISDSEEAPGLRSVRVEVSWRGPQARRISRSLSTLIAEARTCHEASEPRLYPARSHAGWRADGECAGHGLEALYICATYERV